MGVRSMKKIFRHVTRAGKLQGKNTQEQRSQRAPGTEDSQRADNAKQHRGGFAPIPWRTKDMAPQAGESDASEDGQQ
jgi:hypothetical protein